MYFLCQFRYTDPSNCTLNSEYSKASHSSHEIFLCTNVACSQNSVQYLENSMTYYGCYTKSADKITDKADVSVKVVRKGSSGPVGIACFESTWTKMSPGMACKFLKNFTFSAYPNLKLYDVYIITCNKLDDEFPNGDDPRIQIYGFDTEPMAINVIEPVLFPTQLIKCVSNCLEVVPKFHVIVGGQYLIVSNNTIKVRTDKISENVKIQKIETVCSSSKHKVDLAFDIANNITGFLLSQSGGRTRNPIVYDAGENVGCFVVGSSTRTNQVGTSPQSYATLVTLDSSNTVNEFFTIKNATQFEIPEGLSPSEIFSYFCYYGELSSSDMYVIKMDKIYIGARFKTKLASNEKIHDFDYPPKTKIWCDAKYYKDLNTSLNFQTTTINTAIYIIYAKNTTFPMSHLPNYIDKEWDNGTNGELEFNRKYENLQMYVFCTVNMYTTTPVPIFAGDRPKLKIIFIHPKWSTEYHLRGFVMECQGSDVSGIDLTCLNCLPDMRMNIEKRDGNTIRLTVPMDFKRNYLVNYRCNGYSNRYDASSITISLNIIVSEYTDIDTRNSFFEYGSDSVQCYSQFTVQDNIGKSITKEIIMPIQVKIDGGSPLNKDGLDQKVILQKIGSQGWGVNFHACCPPFGKDGQYSCIGRWKILLVAFNYNVMFNLDINEIFPGNLIKCFICVNFTNTQFIRTCNGENRIQTLIRIRVIYPDSKETIEEKESVNAPVEQLRPDKNGYYKITEYKVEIGCKVRGVLNMIEVKMKSCNLNPPKIHISPPDKTMFLVGDIFSCTTEAVNCKNGLTYTIYVQRFGEPTDKRDSHSFTLELSHTGNNIQIKCAAGDEMQSTDVRFIRVEMGPYNVSIPNVLTIMVYGNYFRCNALGFPPPTITWTQLKGDSQLRISESFMLIGPWDFPGDYMIQCEAKNKRGSVSVSAQFKVFNPRIVYPDYSLEFYCLIPSLTVIYILLLTLSIFIIFQEIFFGVPFFSQGSTEVIKSQKASSPKVIQRPSTRESVLSTQQQ